MTLRRLPLAILILACLLPAAVSEAPAQTNTTGVLYALSPASAFEEGCFDPCLCIVHYNDGLVGTWRLTPAPPEPQFAVYRIDQISWLVPGLDRRVTGSGTYRTGGEFARTHRLELDLTIDDQPPQHFDSGLQLGGAEFPAIALTVSMNNLVCHDTVFHVNAAPIVPKLVPYGLFGSTYDEGCFGPCDCAVVSRPLLGRFGLMRLRSDEEGIDYAVLDVRWMRGSPTAVANDTIPVTGHGIYRTRRGGGITTVMPSHRMTLYLSENGQAPVRFDSGIVTGGEHGPGGGPPKRIDIDLAEHGFACLDRVYSLHARRRTAATADFGAIDADPAPVPVTPVP
ncbi:MAG TPA: hypothetical protein VFD06_09595 [Candidatus Polarisedimenticolia bacterium]|nr:hypothetical protein [Candidatus Polarisedimenticolia bacterium]